MRGRTHYIAEPTGCPGDQDYAFAHGENSGKDDRLALGGKLDGGGAAV